MNEGPVTRLTRALADRHRIEREIGSGGMATVYLAQDLKHDRKVAVKVLKPELAAVVGTERFLAEIRTTANLSHPHILPLHDSGEADGFLFFVMPYVEGDSLRERLDRDGQLPVEEAVRVAGHVADALDYAHQQGVIHRDIKPGNILFQAGDPVVTDFGIALAVSAAGEGRLTETGLSLGTPYYMSPEQAAGDQTPTAASDVYSLGCVLYEMLTGEPPHTGTSAQAILGKILLADVTRPTKLRRTIPANVEAAVLKALERLPADRFDSATGLAAALKDKAFRHGAATAPAVAGPWKGLALMSAAVAFVAVIFALLVRFGEEPGPVRWLSLSFPPDSGLAIRDGPSVALSPDGSQMVYVGPGAEGGVALWVKDFDELAPRRLPGTEGAWQPFYSPDGERIGFIAAGDAGPRTLKVISPGGGTPLELGVAHLGGGSWSSDGFIYVKAGTEHEGGLGRVPDAGGEFMPVTTPKEGEVLHRYPEVLPNGRGLIFTAVRTGAYEYGEAEIAVADLRTGEHRFLMHGVLARYAASGHLLVVGSDGSLLAAPFDQNDLTAGDPVTLAQGVQAGDQYLGLALSSEGTLVYTAGQDPGEVVWVDRNGRAEPLDADWGADDFGALALSPDGRRLALGIGARRGTQIWVKELPDGPLTPLTSDEGNSRRPTWSLDGATIAYVRFGPGGREIRVVASDGSSVGAYDVLLDSVEAGVREWVYTPDGQGVVFRRGTVGTADIGYLDLATGERNDTLLATESTEWAVALSSDGNWMAYVSDETGREEVYVCRFPDMSGFRRVSRDGGTEPVWNPAEDGNELFYRRGDGRMISATYSADSVFTVEDRESLFDARPFRSGGGWHYYDYSPTEDRFVMVRSTNFTSGPFAPDLIMVQSFFTELEERVGGGR